MAREISQSVCYFDLNLKEIGTSDAIQFSKNNSRIDENTPEQERTDATECTFKNIGDPSQGKAVLDLSVDLNQECDKPSIENISESFTETDGNDEKPKKRRKRSSSLSSLALLKQALQVINNDDTYDQKLRRVSSIPGTSSSGTAGGETQLEDGLLTTTLCSTEL